MRERREEVGGLRGGGKNKRGREERGREGRKERGRERWKRLTRATENPQISSIV